MAHFSYFVLWVHLQAMSDNTNLGNNTLDAFGHSGNYNVTSSGPSGGTDIFTVDSVRNSSYPRQPPLVPLASPPPSYSNATVANNSKLDMGQSYAKIRFQWNR